MTIEAGPCKAALENHFVGGSKCIIGMKNTIIHTPFLALSSDRLNWHLAPVVIAIDIVFFFGTCICVIYI